MNTKNLIIAFITVSIAALIVSAFAVFAAARSQYSALLASVTEAEDIRTDDVTESPKTSEDTEISSAPETSSSPETTPEITQIETIPEETSAEESSEQISTEVEETTSAPYGYTLKLEGDRLIVRTPEGTNVCERIIDSSVLHPKDLEALRAGILFSNESEAISAVCDIIS